MPIPTSGPISMSMFNTILGRAFNTTDSRLASASAPWSGSLFWLANQSGTLNQTAPHAMSEWYNYDVTPSITVYPVINRIGDGGTGCIDGIITYNVVFSGTVPSTGETIEPNDQLGFYYRRTGASFINSGSEFTVNDYTIITNCNV